MNVYFAPSSDNPFRRGDWVTWANLVRGANLGPFVVMDSSTDWVRLGDPDYISAEEGQWHPADLFQKYNPEEHLKAVIEYYAIVKGQASRIP
jgi:hypothetical protein